MALTASDLATIALLEGSDGRAEYYDGELREKPPMSVRHNRSMWRIVHQLDLQLDPREFEVRMNAGYTAIPRGNYYIPDVEVIPVRMVDEAERTSPRLETYRDPLPFVVEIWSPSTGTYDIDAKIPGYRERGDVEIWRMHPGDRTTRMWRRQPDGTYTETLLRGGTVRLHALPDVTIDLDEVFGKV